MQDLVLALKMKYGGKSPESLIRTYRVNLFCEKVAEWEKAVLAKKSMNQEDKKMFVMLQEATSDIIDQVREDREKAEAWGYVAAELQNRNNALNKENEELKATIENLRKNIDEVF